MSDPTVQTAPIEAESYAHCEHVVQFYADDNFFLDVLSRFVGGALATGEAALVIATAAHQAELERRLSARGLDTAKAKLQARYLVLDAGELLERITVNGSLSETRFNEIVGRVLKQAETATAGKERRIAVFGELVALLWARGRQQDAIRVEQLWNELAQTHSFSLLCAYPIVGFNNETHVEPFLKICGHHSGVVPSESYLGLGSEEERFRTIAQLQQKALVLEKRLAARQSENQFRLLVEVVRDYAIFMLDPQGIISTWNIGAERIKGYQAREIIGRHFSCFYPEEDVRSGKPAWELVVAAREGRLQDEGWRIRKDGSRFWANVIITAIRDDQGALLGFAKVTRDVTEQMQAQQALQKEVMERRDAQRQLHSSEESLRQLSLHLLRTQDEERRRIGADLHDSLGQYLTVLKLKLASLNHTVGQDGTTAAEDLAQCLRLTDDCIKEVRTVSYLLYPPLLEEMGLKSAIPWYLEGFGARSGIETSFEAHPDFGRMPRDSELALFRVLQESLTNVHRHSGSPTAHIRLFAQEDMACLEIEDKGKGISPHLLEQSGQDWMGALGVGLRGMNERMRQLGGKLEVFSKESGTRVRASLPMPESQSAASA